MERPILFSAPMVRAIIEGRKTQTRRIVKPVPQMVDNKKTATWEGDAAALMRLFDQVGRSCPYGHSGERLWVRETWRTDESLDDKAPSVFSGWPVRYEADGVVLKHGAFFGNTNGKTRVSIHMPRWASRILLEITGVHVERLNEISEADVLAEGFLTREGNAAFNGYGSREYFIPEMLDKNPTGRVACGANTSAQQAYRKLWSDINGADSWAANPWVWVISFEVVSHG